METLEIEWQLVPSMCMLLGYAARYTDRPEDCKLGVKTAIDVLNETMLTCKYAESSLLLSGCHICIIQYNNAQNTYVVLGGGALLNWVSKHKNSFFIAYTHAF